MANCSLLLDSLTKQIVPAPQTQALGCRPAAGLAVTPFQRTADRPPFPATAKAFSAVPVLLTSAEIEAQPNPTPKPRGTGAPGSMPGSGRVQGCHRQGFSLQMVPGKCQPDHVFGGLV